MIFGLMLAVVCVGLALALWLGSQAYRRRPTTEAQMVAAIVAEALLLVQTAIALVSLARGTRLAETVTFIAYSIGVLLPMPLGFYIAREERTRWGSIALAFTSLVIAVMTLRQHQLWQVTHV